MAVLVENRVLNPDPLCNRSQPSAGSRTTISPIKQTIGEGWVFQFSQTVQDPTSRDNVPLQFLRCQNCQIGSSAAFLLHLSRFREAAPGGFMTWNGTIDERVT